MQVTICDKCKKQYGTFHEQAVRFPIVEVNVIRESAVYFQDKKVDLCPDCQKAVYEFIFGKEWKDETSRRHN